MNALILGGTGAMGKYLTDYLNCDVEFQNIYVTSRKQLSSDHKVRFIQGNAKDYSFISGLLKTQDFDVVVDFMSYSTQEFKERVDDFLNLTKHYVFLSSSRVYADLEKTPITENSPRLLDVVHDIEYLKTDEYALSKARQEDILRKNRNNNWTIIRPYITYSSQRLQLGIYEKEQWLYRALQNKPIVFPEELRNTLTTLTGGVMWHGISRSL